MTPSDTSWDIMYIMKPLKVAPFMTVSMMAPSSIVLSIHGIHRVVWATAQLMTHPKTSWEIMHITVKPLGLAPFWTVSMMAPSSMMLAVVMEPRLRPIQSPIAPRKHMPRMMPASAHA